MSQAGWDWRINDQSDDELDDDDEYVGGKDALLFCIEVSHAMFDKLDPADDKSPSVLLACLKCALSLMKRKVMVSGNDLFGILLFNTAARKDPEEGIGTGGGDHLYLLHDLEQVSAQGIQSLKAIIKDADSDPEAFAQRFRPKSSDTLTALPNAIKTCVGLMRERVKHSTKAACRVFMITDNDDPFPEHSPDATHLRNVTLKLSQDMREMKTELIPFFLTHLQDAEFNVNKFYKAMLALFDIDMEAEDSKNQFSITAGPKMFDELLAQLSIRQSTRRAQFSIPFRLGDGLEIGIQGFSLVTETKKSSPVLLDTSGRDVRQVKQIIEYHDSDRAEPLNPKTQLKPFLPMGDEKKGQTAVKVVFSDEELKALKTLGIKPSLRLLGFTTLEKFKPEHQMGHSYFIYPTEDEIRASGKSYTGSKRVFTSLLLTMIEKERVGLGVLIARATSSPRHVLIVPQEEKLDENDKQVEPPGFHLLPLCFADDIRDLNASGSIPIATDVDPESVGNMAINVMKKIVGKLKQQFDPDNYQSPALNYHYDCLQAIALKEELPEPVDATLPLYHAIKSRAGKLIEELKSLVDAHPEAALAETSQAAAVSGTKRKPVTEESEQDMIGNLCCGNTSKVLVNDLKAYLRKHGLDAAGRKADLLLRVEAHLKESGQWNESSSSQSGRKTKKRKVKVSDSATEEE